MVENNKMINKEFVTENKKDKVIVVSEEQINSLLCKGIIVALHIGRNRFALKISPEELKLSKNLTELVNARGYLGTWMTMVEDFVSFLNTVEVRARQNLKQHSFSTVWGNFIPFTSFDSWKKRNDELSKRFFDKRDEIISNLEQIKKSLYEEYFEFSKDRSLAKKIVNAVPSVLEIQNNFYFETVYTIIPLLQFSSSKNKIGEEEFPENIRKPLTIEYVKNKKKYIDSFIDSLFGKVYGMIQETIEKLISSIEQGNFSGRSLKQVKTLIEKLEKFSFYEDIFNKDINLKSKIEKLKLALTMQSADLMTSLLKLRDQTTKELILSKNRKYTFLERL